MSPAQPLGAPLGLLPLPRPLMTGEVLDAAFRLFRATLLRCLPYSGLAVLVLELPTLYAAFLIPERAGGSFVVSHFRMTGFAVVLLLSVALLGVLTLRLHAVSRGAKPRFRGELLTVLRRWPNAVIATSAALGFPMLLYTIASMVNLLVPNVVIYVVGLVLVWPMALFAVALPAFWCDGLGPFAAIGRAV